MTGTPRAHDAADLENRSTTESSMRSHPQGHWKRLEIAMQDPRPESRSVCGGVRSRRLLALLRPHHVPYRLKEAQKLWHRWKASLVSNKARPGEVIRRLHQTVVAMFFW